LGTAASIGWASADLGRRGGLRQAAGAIASLAFGVAQGAFARWLSASRHGCVLRYCNALQWSVCMSRPQVTRFSSRSALGRRMMGSGGRGVSICPATWRHCCRPVPDTQRDHLAHRPHGNDAAPPSSGGNWNSSAHAAAAGAAACLPQRNSLPSAHMRCRITASLRATATRARAMPRRLATFIPHARSADHLLLRISSE